MLRIGSFGRNIAIELTELPSHLSGHFQIRKLILPDGHLLRPQGKNIRNLSYRLKRRSKRIRVAAAMMTTRLARRGFRSRVADDE